MTPSDLQDRFPTMTPIRSPPSLATINGIGFRLYGRRDDDAETESYVTTRCLAVFFVPLLAIDAYRVTDAKPGWYFLGKHPLAPWARGWNLLIAASIAIALGVSGWGHYSASPEYRAGVRLTEARSDLAADRLAQASGLFVDLARGDTSHANDGRAGLDAVLARLPHAPVAAAVDAAPILLRSAPPLDPGVVVAAVRALAEAHLTDDPALALGLVDLLRLRADAAADLGERRLDLLTRLNAAQPANPRWAVDLALIAEAADDLARCEALLAPHRDRLGSGEGARILGRILADRGEHEAAHALLFPYCSERLKHLRAVEKAYDEAYTTANDRALEELRNDAAPTDWYRRYNVADKTAQGVMVDDWIRPRLKADANLAARQTELRAAAAIVPVAIDLGIVTLRRSQGLTDPAARQKELESSEQVFLAIRGFAGESDAYRLFYGQVCGWLGKHEESRKQFDDLLATHKRSPGMLVQVARTVRYLGDNVQSRALAEESWRTAADDHERWGAADLRACTPLDPADQVLWLGRCDPADAGAKAQLEAARGAQAIEAGDEATAVRHLRQAVADYAALEQRSATLNNAALVYGRLFTVSGERTALDHAVALFDESLALAPSDSITQSNLAGWLLARGAMATIGPRLDLAALRSDGDELNFCYQDQDGRAEVAATFAAHPDTRRALTLSDGMQILRPRDASVYRLPLRVLRLTRDVAALTSLRDRIRAAKLAQHQSAGTDPTPDSQQVRHRADSRQTRSRQRLEAIASGTPTWAVAATEVVYADLWVADCGGSIDLDACVALAEKASATQPSCGSSDALMVALEYRLDARLRRAGGAYATARTEHPGISISRILSLTAGRDPQVATDADVQRIAAMVLAEIPEEVSIWGWALREQLHISSKAETFAAQMASDPARGLIYEINLLLDPSDGDDVLNLYWWRKLTGDEAGALQVLSEAHERKVDLPALD